MNPPRAPHDPASGAPSEPPRPRAFAAGDRRLLIGAVAFALAAVIVDRILHAFGIGP